MMGRKLTGRTFVIASIVVVAIACVASATWDISHSGRISGFSSVGGGADTITGYSDTQGYFIGPIQWQKVSVESSLSMTDELGDSASDFCSASVEEGDHVSCSTLAQSPNYANWQEIVLTGNHYGEDNMESWSTKTEVKLVW